MILHRLLAQKFDGSVCHQSVGRPCVAEEIEPLVVRMTEEPPDPGLPTHPKGVGGLGTRINRPRSVTCCIARSRFTPAIASREGAKRLWANLSEVYRTQATFSMAQYDVSIGVIPDERHQAMTQDTGNRSHRAFPSHATPACLSSGA
jgi:hypothetical protein